VCVFPTLDGSSPILEKVFVRAWDRLRARAAKEGLRTLPFHCTRHTFATLALRSGKSLRWVPKMLGHASPMTTLSHYVHAMSDEDFDSVVGSEGRCGLTVTKPHRQTPRSRNSGAQGADFTGAGNGLEPATLSLGKRSRTKK